MNLLTQNADLKKTGVWGWTLPAHNVEYEDGSVFNVCPSAGICADFCYAKSGTYRFSNVMKAHKEKLDLVRNNMDGWRDMMIGELKKKKYDKGFIRIHDGGDFFSKKYALTWFKIAIAHPDKLFYAYTKEVKMFKAILKDKIPENFTIIYSFGGKQDKLIDKNVDRHSDVFGSYDEMIEEGYVDIEDDDRLAAISDNHKIGIYRNNIRHLVKKMGDKTFSEIQTEEK